MGRSKGGHLDVRPVTPNDNRLPFVPAEVVDARVHDQTADHNVIDKLVPLLHPHHELALEVSYQLSHRYPQHAPCLRQEPNHSYAARLQGRRQGRGGSVALVARNAVHHRPHQAVAKGLQRRENILRPDPGGVPDNGEHPGVQGLGKVCG